LIRMLIWPVVLFVMSGAVFAQDRVVVPKPSRTGKLVLMKVTAYCPCAICTEKYADGKTALGDNARTVKGVAGDFSVLGKRTLLKIPGIGIREVDDTGGEMRRATQKGYYHIDVRLPTHDVAYRYGVKYLLVEVIVR
jgi:3D (Asp-Asp-Asp) domain-containing protein